MSSAIVVGMKPASSTLGQNKTPTLQADVLHPTTSWQQTPLGTLGTHSNLRAEVPDHRDNSAMLSWSTPDSIELNKFSDTYLQVEQTLVQRPQSKRPRAQDSHIVDAKSARSYADFRSAIQQVNVWASNLAELKHRVGSIYDDETIDDIHNPTSIYFSMSTKCTWANKERVKAVVDGIFSYLPAAFDCRENRNYLIEKFWNAGGRGLRSIDNEDRTDRLKSACSDFIDLAYTIWADLENDADEITSLFGVDPSTEDAKMEIVLVNSTKSRKGHGALGGRGQVPAVIKMHNESGEQRTIIWKPRRADVLYDFCGHSNSLVTKLGLPYYPVLSRSDHHFSEFLQPDQTHLKIDSQEELGSYFFNVCLVDACLKLLGITDMHCENTAAIKSSLDGTVALMPIDVEIYDQTQCDYQPCGFAMPSDQDSTSGAFVFKFNGKTQKNAVWIKTDFAKQLLDDQQASEVDTCTSGYYCPAGLSSLSINRFYDFAAMKKAVFNWVKSEYSLMKMIYAMQDKMYSHRPRFAVAAQGNPEFWSALDVAKPDRIADVYFEHIAQFLATPIQGDQKIKAVKDRLTLIFSHNDLPEIQLDTQTKALYLEEIELGRLKREMPLT